MVGGIRELLFSSPEQVLGYFRAVNSLESSHSCVLFAFLLRKAASGQEGLYWPNPHGPRMCSGWAGAKGALRASPPAAPAALPVHQAWPPGLTADVSEASEDLGELGPIEQHRKSSCCEHCMGHSLM